MSINTVLENYKVLFENLTPQAVEHDFLSIFAHDIYFKDPFNEVQGLVATQAVFHHMFKTLHEPQFQIIDMAGAARSGYLEWVFNFKLKAGASAKTQQIKGVSRILINDSQQVCSHIDYWDTGEFVYSKIPLLGRVIQFINKRVSVP